MTIHLDANRADLLYAAKWLLALILLAALLRFAHERFTAWSHRKWVTQRDHIDNERDRERTNAERAEAEAEAEARGAYRRDNPLPGPMLAGECVRRLAYADACDTAGRPTEANRQRAVAGQLGALSQLALMATDEDDRADWSAELSAARTLVGAELPALPGWKDPHPPLTATGNGPYADEGTPQWCEAVEALRQAVLDNARPDDFGPGQSGRGVLASAAVYGYAAAPELPRETVEAFLSDWCLALYGDAPERTWPVMLPDPRKAPRMAHIGPEDQEWPDAIARLRRAVDIVLHPADFRGLMGRGKSQIIADMDGRDLIPFGLADEVVDAYVGDYSLAITGQKPANTWPAGTMPDTDESRVMPLRDELQPPELS